MLLIVPTQFILVQTQIVSVERGMSDIIRAVRLERVRWAGAVPGSPAPAVSAANSKTNLPLLLQHQHMLIKSK